MIRALLLAACALLLAAPAPAQVSMLMPSGSLIDQQEVTLDASGNATWTYSRPFPGVPAVVHLPASPSAADALICNYSSVSATSVSVHCFRTNILAPLLTGLLGGTTVGLKVTLVARYIP